MPSTNPFLQPRPIEPRSLESRGQEPRDLLPRAVRESWETIRRDVRQVWRGLAGTRPLPYLTRPKKASAVAPRSAADVLAARDVRITRLTRETKDAVCLELEDVRGDGFAFEPGQFLTLVLRIDGESYRRAYSICSTPDASGRPSPRVTVTTKRVEGGVVSTFVNERLAVGDIVQVLGPSGAFTLPKAEAARHVVLLGGGSGITPLFSIASHVLATEPSAHVSLVYGNRGVEDVIFREALATLAATHEGRFHLRHVLSEPPAGWSHGTGLLTRDVVSRELEALSAPADLACEYFVCGPEGMMAEARAALLARGVPEARIREERFTQPHKRSKPEEAQPGAATIRAAGREFHLIVAPTQTLLEAGLEAGAPMPFSCAMGGCGACRVKVVEGSMQMEEPNCLSEQERGAGYALACIGRPAGKVVVEV